MIPYKQIGLILLAAATFAACGPDFITEQRHEIANNGSWTYADTCDFAFQIDDTSHLYNLYLELESADTFRTQNIYLQLQTKFPNGRRIQMTPSFDVYDVHGKPIGRCSDGHCTQRILMQEKAFFNQSGQYVITVGQWMRQDSLPGIRAVGLAVEKLTASR
jgi:gliding motility-associated lipoprotein GldH